jgi:HSP20 family protein
MERESRRTGMGAREPSTANQAQERRGIMPAVDVYESEDEILLLADMPGVATGGARVRVEDMELTIEGTRAEGEREAANAEDQSFDYQRSFLLPQGVDAEKIVAEMAHGVLRVHLPKAAARAPFETSIKAG